MLWHKNSKPILETRLGRAFLYTSLFFVTLSCALLFCTALIFTAFGFIEYSGRLQCLDSRLRQPVVGFGQYRNKTWNEVADMNPSYIVWAYENVTNRKLCSVPLAAWCGFVDKTQRAQAVDQTGDDIDLRDIPEDDVPF